MQSTATTGEVMKRLAIGALTAGLLVGAVVALPRHVSAAESHSGCIGFDTYGNLILTPNCSETMHGGQDLSIPTTNPCNGGSGTLDLSITEAVYHITVNGAGDAWDTGTETGTGVFTPDDGADPGGSGKFSTWFGDEFNMQNVVQPATFSVVVHLSNGQTATFHMASNTVFTPGGATITVNQLRAGCS